MREGTSLLTVILTSTEIMCVQQHDTVLYSSLAIVIHEMVVRCGGITLAWDTPKPGEKEILSTQSRLLDGGGRVGHKREPKVE